MTGIKNPYTWEPRWLTADRCHCGEPLMEPTPTYFPWSSEDRVLFCSIPCMFEEVGR